MHVRPTGTRVLAVLTLPCRQPGMLLRRVTSSAAGSRRLPGCSSVHLRVPHRCACASTASGGGASGGGRSGGDKERDSEHALPPESVLVRGINEVMRAQPFSCIGYVMACRYAVFFPVVYCVRHFQLAVPTELALAYVLTRPLVKLRFPVELGVAALLSHAFPALTQVKVSALLGLLPTASEAAAARRERPFHTVTDYLVASYPSRTATDPVSSVMARLAGPADRYGAAYYVRTCRALLVLRGAPSRLTNCCVACVRAVLA